MSKKLIFMAGGTGGHVIPALSVAHAIAEKGYEIHWLGTLAGIEAELVPKAGYQLHPLEIKGLRGKGIKALLTAPFKIMGAIKQAYRVLNKIKPDVVIGFGGYATGPGGVAAKLMGLPLIVHEQNAVAGTTNKLLNKISDVTLQAFPNTLKDAITAGNPVRQSVMQVPDYQINTGSGSLNVLVVGGSLGAVALNNTVLEALRQIPAHQQPDVWHQVGKRNIQDAEAAYQEAGVSARVCAFIDDMNDAYAWADLIICRSGALTVSEIAAAGRAAIFVPFPYAIDDHQTENARWLENNQAAVICPQTELTETWLIEQWQHYNEHRNELKMMADNAKSAAMTTATETVVEQIMRYANEH